MSVLFIKLSLITIRSEKDIRHQVRGSAHLFTDGFKIYAGITFDDQFIMNVSDDKAVTESFHGVAEDVSADGLDDVLHKLRTVGFDAFPFLCGSNVFFARPFCRKLQKKNVGCCKTVL